MGTFADKYMILLYIVKNGCMIKTVKVKAHNERAQNLNPENRWRSVANAEVVHQAKNVITCHYRGLFTQICEFQSDIQNKRNSLKEIIMFQVAAWRAAKVTAQKISNDTVPTIWYGCGAKLGASSRPTGQHGAMGSWIFIIPTILSVLS